MKASTLSLIGAAVLAGSSAMATSIPINGTIDFAGGFSLADSANNPTSDFTVATKFSSFDNVHVDHNGTGAYLAVPALTTGVTYNGFTFDPINASTPLTPLWSFTLTGVTYSFDLTSFVVDTRSQTSIHLIGTGIAHIDNGLGTFADTQGTWDLAAGDATTFHFSAG